MFFYFFFIKHTHTHTHIIIIIKDGQTKTNDAVASLGTNKEGVNTKFAALSKRSSGTSEEMSREEPQSTLKTNMNWSPIKRVG